MDKQEGVWVWVTESEWNTVKLNVTPTQKHNKSYCQVWVKRMGKKEKNEERKKLGKQMNWEEEMS